MIDTIIFRVHNLQKSYPLLYEQLYAPTAKKNTILEAVVDTDTGEVLKNSFLHSFVYSDNRRVIPLTFRTSLPSNSYHYSVSYVIKTSEDFAEFNFSIPKYLFAQNVQQFINFNDNSSKVIFAELMRFMSTFFDDVFLQRPTLSDIEFCRLDLCYNQFFNSKDDALLYLDYQKKLHQVKAKSDKNRCRTYGTSLMYTTRRYSFKIYHKGTEFAKHDKKEIVKSKNPRNLDLNYFQYHADTILRYEMTFRASQFNYLFKQYFYSGKRHADNILNTQSPYFVRLRKFVSLGHKVQVESFIEKQKKFLLHSSWSDSVYFNYSLIDDYEVSLNGDFFDILYREFWAKVKAYQLSNDLDINVIVKRITGHNDDVKLKNNLRAKNQKELSNFRMLSVALLVQNGYDLADFKQYLPRSSYYDLVADLKKIGLNTRSAHIGVPTPPLDYHDYKLYFLKYH